MKSSPETENKERRAGESLPFLCLEAATEKHICQGDMSSWGVGETHVHGGEIKMRDRVVILGKPVAAIYENVSNARCWYVTSKVPEEAHAFLSGYVHCFRPPMLAEFQHVPEEALLDVGEPMWNVPQEHWWRCPLTDIEDLGGPKVAHCQGEEAA